MKKRSAKKQACILGIGLLIAAAAGICVGSIPIRISDLFRLIGCRLSGKPIPADMGWIDTIIFQLRLPRTLMMLLVGAALSGSGAVYQGLFRNPLADPYLIGVSAGAGLGAVIALSFPVNTTFIGAYIIPLFAFLFALLTVTVVFNLGRMGGYLNITGLLLAGVAVNAFASAMTSGWMLLSGQEMKRSFSWMLGGGVSVGWREILITAPLILLGIAGMIRYAYPLNLLQYGDEQALRMGVPVKRVRNRLILYATLTTSSAIAFTGVIGFVGIIVPHLLRILGNNDYRKLIPLSVLGGALFLGSADILARVLLAPEEIPVGIITALTGAPFFLWVLNRNNHAKV